VSETVAIVPPPSAPGGDSPSVAVGDVIGGKYRVDHVLGEGGMGLVVAVTHLKLDHLFAIKILKPALAARPDVVARFTREARAAVKMKSEHVARVHDVGTLPSGVPFMVMEHLEGEDLAHMLARRGPLPTREAVALALEAAEAVAEAHALGIVHRDLKPGNLFLAKRPSGKPILKVLDFGISKIADAAPGPAITSDDALVGSPGYMSPEQMVAAKTADQRTDVWALGVVLYEMLSGKRPFVADTMPELVACVIAKPHEDLREIRPELPQGLCAAIDRCLEKEAADRFASVGDLVGALSPFAPPPEQHERALGR
jgi:serine/threonine-protein kinase